MRPLLICILTLFFVINKTKADETFSPHTMGHIVGGIGSFFLGPLPGLGLSILPEAISILGNDEYSSNTSKKVFYVNEYSSEYEIVPHYAESSDDLITKYENTVKLTNSLKYY